MSGKISWLHSAVIQRCRDTSQQCKNQEDSSNFWVTESWGGYITIFDSLCKHPSQVSVKFRAAGILVTISFKFNGITNVITDQVHHLEPLQQLAVPVLQPVGFINDYAAPWNIPQLRTISQNHFKCSDDGMKLIGPLYHTTLWEQIWIII